MRARALLPFFVVLLLAAGCASTGGRFRGADDRHEIGVASYYGGEFHGRRTASGERYHQGKLTAAHPTLPFGTHVRVTNLENGESVVLRINDRGPFLKGRIIDVSKKAARELGFVRAGTARVRVEILPG
jgi:rare lipoprotein A